MSVDGKKLQQLRIEAGFSQEKLAIMSNVNRRTIQRAEAGKPVSLETLTFIADALSVSLTELRIAAPETEGTTGQNIESINFDGPMFEQKWLQVDNSTRLFLVIGGLLLGIFVLGIFWTTSQNASPLIGVTTPIETATSNAKEWNWKASTTSEDPQTTIMTFLPAYNGQTTSKIPQLGHPSSFGYPVAEVADLRSHYAGYKTHWRTAFSSRQGLQVQPVFQTEIKGVERWSCSFQSGKMNSFSGNVIDLQIYQSSGSFKDWQPLDQTYELDYEIDYREALYRLYDASGKIILGEHGEVSTRVEGGSDEFVCFDHVFYGVRDVTGEKENHWFCAMGINRIKKSAYRLTNSERSKFGTPFTLGVDIGVCSLIK